MSRSRFNWSSILLATALCTAVSAQQLGIEEAVVSDFAGGFGTPLSYQFSPGQKAHLAFYIRGFQTADTDQPRQRKAMLTYTIEAVDCLGRLLSPPQAGQVSQLLLPRDRNWAPVITYAVEIPSTPAAGTHNFHVRVHDKVSGSTAALEVPFEVQSPFDEPEPTLSVDRFRFYASEADRDPVPGSAVFRPGDSVWGRFLLSGFRTEGANRYDLQYDVSVRNPAGRTLLNQPKAAAESKESFYPKSHVSGVISILLERSIRPGSYFLVLSAVDSIGKQQVKAEYPFRVAN